MEIGNARKARNAIEFIELMKCGGGKRRKWSIGVMG
jgi:hypothetical protein